ncbi:MAG: DUF4294 domain-containing protein [Bacteroidetes bacterium]|nr:DUF4294 domain-containing protein [Bacteroidota bacterium]
MRSLIFVLFLLITTGAKAQLPDGRKVSLGTTVGNDTIPMVNLPVVDIYAAIDPAHAENLKRYLKLRRDVLRAYPYAKLASQQLKLINDSTLKIKSERARKKFIKEKEKDLKARFEKDLKNLTYTQGRILIKLIDLKPAILLMNLLKISEVVSRLFSGKVLPDCLAQILNRNTMLPEDRLIEGIVQAIGKR